MYSVPMGCYCEERRTNPDVADTMKNIPEGYCGICEICGAPGHTRTHPRLPVTSAWCDTHYASLLRPGITPDRVLSWVILAVAAIALAVAMYRMLR